jgi:thiamine-phosphate pyrophosphorylase
MPNERLPLPVLMLVTDRNVAGGDDALVRKVEEAVAGGVNAVQLREKELAHDKLVALARRLREVIAGRALLLVNGSPVAAREVNADGVHMPEYAASLVERPPGLLAGRSVHSPEAALRAEAESVDYVVFGPIYETLSHVATMPAGCAALREVAAAVSIPVIAIGGVTAPSVQEVMHAGASGVAVIRAILASDNARAAAAAFRDALSAERARA